MPSARTSAWLPLHRNTYSLLSRRTYLLFKSCRKLWTDVLMSCAVFKVLFQVSAGSSRSFCLSTAFGKFEARTVDFATARAENWWVFSQCCEQKFCSSSDFPWRMSYFAKVNTASIEDVYFKRLDISASRSHCSSYTFLNANGDKHTFLL